MHYEIHNSLSGGKAGKGRNKTSTIQVRNYCLKGGDYLLEKQFRFKVGDRHSRDAAILKAEQYIHKKGEEKGESILYGFAPGVTAYPKP